MHRRCAKASADLGYSKATGGLCPVVSLPTAYRLPLTAYGKVPFRKARR